jgi:hypothetical protein
MRVRGILREYDLNEAAIILKLPTAELRDGIQTGQLAYFYRIGDDYKFHDASLETNQSILQQKRANPLNKPTG